MSLIGQNNEEKIWNYLKTKIQNDYAVAGIMGNIFAESGCRPNNLQNSYEKALNLTDDEYTKAVDNGTYTNFINDKAGYGLVQWTFWSLKRDFYNYVKSKNKSIGDLEIQLEFLCKQLSESYAATVWNPLKNSKSVLEASNIMLLKFERPTDQSVSVQEKRASYGQKYYDKYARKENNNMSNSNLVNCTVMSPNHSGKRTHSIDRITPHCVVGQLSAEGIGGCFTSTRRQASCNYGIGYDGRVSLIVDECNRSWCSSSNANDQRAVTIEVASDKTAPYAFKTAAYNKLIDLCEDICRRNGKKKLLWISNKDTALNYNPANDEMLLTVHRWFANKSCPGDWMYSRMGDLANEVTKRLGGKVDSQQPEQQESKVEKTNNVPSQVPFTVQILISDLNYRSEPKMGNNIKGQTGKGVFTITQVSNGWGKLKSGVGWIYLENAEYVKINSPVVNQPTVSQPTSNAATTSYKDGDIIKLKPGSTYANGKTIPQWVFNSTLYYRGKNDEGIIFSTLKIGAITGVVKEAAITSSQASTKQASAYVVKVTANSLNIRKGPGTNYQIAGSITDKGSYTIVETQSNWGKLKSGIGWICLDYTKKI